MKPLMLDEKILSETLHHLQEGGKKRIECVVLWLGREEESFIKIHQVYRPEQMAGADVFRIPPVSMQKLLTELGEKDLMIAAQVHSHPHEAFHSRADDAWAIVRHIDALSLVLPNFSMQTSAVSFFEDVKTFHLTSANRWIEVNKGEIEKWMKLQ